MPNNQYHPTDPSPPSETIRDWMQENGISTEQFAEKLGWDLALAEQLVAGKIRITEDVAFRVGVATNVPAGFWLRRQGLYDYLSRHPSKTLGDLLLEPQDDLDAVITSDTLTITDKTGLMLQASRDLDEADKAYVEGQQDGLTLRDAEEARARGTDPMGSITHPRTFSISVYEDRHGDHRVVVSSGDRRLEGVAKKYGQAGLSPDRRASLLDNQTSHLIRMLGKQLERQLDGRE